MKKIHEKKFIDKVKSKEFPTLNYEQRKKMMH